MATLSHQLTNLAEGLDGATPTSRRTAAQMLALATGLDPSNHKARALIQRFEKKDFHPTADAEKLKSSREKIWKLLEWLDTPEAGGAGNALAACLTDVIIVSDSQHSKAESLLTQGERGAWSGWVPDLSAYELDQSVKPDKLAEELPKKTEPSNFPTLLSKAKISTPLWKNIGPAALPEWILASGPLEMTAEMVSEPDQPFAIMIGPQTEENPFAPLSETLLNLMKQVRQGARLPEGGRIHIHGKALEESSQSGMRQSISAAAAVLASSALTGHEPEATIIGVIDRRGDFTLPSGFWDQLQSIATGEGRKGRLILPAAAADYLPSLLPLEKLQFFLEYEVILASNFSELLALSKKNPDERLAKASLNFQEICAKAAPQTLGQYLVNPFVRRRLLEITQEYPNHFSAKLLAIQGEGNRPIFIPRFVLELEIRRSIKPIEWIVKRDSLAFEDTEIAKLGSSYESSRSALESLTRIVEKADRVILDKALELLARIRSLERAARKKPNFEFDGEAVNLAASAEFTTVVREYKSLLQVLGRSPEENR